MNRRNKFFILIAAAVLVITYKKAVWDYYKRVMN